MTSVSHPGLQLDTSETKPWRGELSCDIRKGALAVSTNAVVLIDENGIAWATVLPDAGGFYGHADRIVAAVNAYSPAPRPGMDFSAAELTYVADQVERAHAIGERPENQYECEDYVPRWKAMIPWALREAARGAAFDFTAYLQRQRDWSEKTFGPGPRSQMVVDHIRKELVEIEADPADLKEWIDVVMLALDGAWRSGASPEQIAAGLAAKLAINERREWPDWRTADLNKAIEHKR